MRAIANITAVTVISVTKTEMVDAIVADNFVCEIIHAVYVAGVVRHPVPAVGGSVLSV